jgi:voltage-gated potassium channel
MIRTPEAWKDPTGELHERIKRATNMPMLVLSIVLTVVLIIPLADRHLSDANRRLLDTLDYALWAAYAIEYFALVATAPKKRTYVAHHVPDLLMVLLPMMRPLRAFRAGRLVIAALAGAEHSRERFASKAALYAAFMAMLAVLCASVMVLSAERDAPGANIKTFGIAVWWAVTTLTTTGYGDYFPVTVAGRIIAGALMLTGLSVLGITTASVASWFVRLTDEKDEIEMARVLAVLERLEARLVAMEQTEVEVLQEAEEVMKEAGDVRESEDST